jgi:glycerate 2-kinase
VRKLKHIHLHAARPAGINEPTQQAVDGTAEILRRVQSLSESDVCIMLLSGGASALLCSPIPGVTLHDKLLVTRALAGAGAPIHELNLVRTQLSQVKGGRLASACRAGTLIALIISDVIGDPLDVIGSGPTTPSRSRATDAIGVLRNRNLLDRIPPTVLTFLKQQAEREESATAMYNFRSQALWSIASWQATRSQLMPRVPKQRRWVMKSNRWDQRTPEKQRTKVVS